MELYNYQKEGVEFLVSNRGGMLWDEQGLGKTIQALCAYKRMKKHSNGKITSLLIVCPAIMRGTWGVEAKKILSDTVSGIVVATKASDIVLNSFVDDVGKTSNARVLICSYEFMVSNYSKLYKSCDLGLFTAIILDEAHYIKTPSSKRAKCAFALSTHPLMRFKVLLTGTPITRDVDDLYIPLSIFYRAVEPNWYRSIFAFRKDVMGCKHNYFGDVYKGFKNEFVREQVKELCKRVSLRRTKRTAGIELPSIIREQVFVDINSSVAKKSLSILDYATKVISGSSNYTNYSEYKTDLAEEANHIASIRKALGVAKVAPTLQYIDLLIEQNVKKIVVFGVHVDVANLLYEALKEKYKEIKTHRIIGATTGAKRDEIIKEFQTEETPQILVANMVACGVGVTLTKSHTVVFAELDFTPANIIQAEARVHRITQEHVVNSIFIIANESLDAKILDLIKEKLTVIKDVLQTSFTKEDIK